MYIRDMKGNGSLSFRVQRLNPVISSAQNVALKTKQKIGFAVSVEINLIRNSGHGGLVTDYNHRDISK